MDTEWAINELEQFIAVAESHHSKSIVGYSVEERREVVSRWPVIERILQVVYPTWRADQRDSPTNEFRQQVDACIHALTLIRRGDDMVARLDPPSPVLSVDDLHPWVWEPARPLWRDGHFRAAVQTAASGLNARLQDKLARRDLADRALVNQSFSADHPSPSRPRLRIPDQGDEQTNRSVHDGLRSLGEVCFQLFRNPASRRIDDLSEQEAIEQLATMSLFARWIERCEVLRSTPAGEYGSSGEQEVR